MATDPHWEKWSRMDTGGLLNLCIEKGLLDGPIRAERDDLIDMLMKDRREKQTHTQNTAPLGPVSYASLSRPDHRGVDLRTDSVFVTDEEEVCESRAYFGTPIVAPATRDNLQRKQPLVSSTEALRNGETASNAVKSCSPQPPMKNANREEVDASEPPHGHTFSPVVAVEERPSDERSSEEKYDMSRPNAKGESDKKVCESNMETSDSEDAKEEAKEETEDCVALLGAPYRQIIVRLRGGASLLTSMRLKHRRPRDGSLPDGFFLRYWPHFLGLEFGSRMRWRVSQTPGNFLLDDFLGTVPQRRLVYLCNFRKSQEAYLKWYMEFWFGVRFVRNNAILRYAKCAHPILMICRTKVPYHVYCPNEMGHLVKYTFQTFRIPMTFLCRECGVWYASVDTFGYFANESHTLFICCFCADKKYAREQLGYAVGVVDSKEEQGLLVGSTIHEFPNLEIYQFDLIYQLNGMIELNLLDFWG